MHQWLKAAAAERGVTDSQMVRDAVEDMLRQRYPHLDPGYVELEEKRMESLRRSRAQTNGYAMQTS